MTWLLISPGQQEEWWWIVLRTQSFYDASFVFTGFGATSDDKIGIMVTLDFECYAYHLPLRWISANDRSMLKRNI